MLKVSRTSQAVVIARKRPCTVHRVAGGLLLLAAILFCAQATYFSSSSRLISIKFPQSNSQNSTGYTSNGHANTNNNGLERFIKLGQRDFRWYIDRPKEPVIYGWEDEWMIAWKRKNYRPDQEASCEHVKLKAPTDDGTLCEMPAYIPPRALPVAPQKITRVIFQSHLYRKTSVSQYIQFASWVTFNPTYEYILFNDNDVDDFICENFDANISLPFSQLVAGASKIDFWRALMMMKYGGVYMDADLIAISPLPIQANENVVSGLGCWQVGSEAFPGVLEHWSMAFSPHHPLPTTTVRFILANLNNPNWNESVQLTTGPGPYKKALTEILAEAQCNPALCNYVWEPDFWKHYCDPEAFSRLFGSLTLFPNLNFNQTYANKLFKTAEYEQSTFRLVHYTLELHKHQQIPDFCSPVKRQERRHERIERWDSALKRNAKKVFERERKRKAGLE